MIGKFGVLQGGHCGSAHGPTAITHYATTKESIPKASKITLGPLVEDASAYNVNRVSSRLVRLVQEFGSQNKWEGWEARISKNEC